MCTPKAGIVRGHQDLLRQGLQSALKGSSMTEHALVSEEFACPGKPSTKAKAQMSPSRSSFRLPTSSQGRDHVPEVPTNFRSQLVHEISSSTEFNAPRPYALAKWL